MIGACAVLVVVFMLYVSGQPDLEVWHTVELDAEFNSESSVKSFADYLELEKRLFDELDRRINAGVTNQKHTRTNRYQKGSLSDPDKWSPNWNRTFELSADTPRAGVLLLHGMSDSPYSLKVFGQRLNAEGAWVIGLRLPGHGTLPSELVRVRWQDMNAAVQIAMRRLHDKVGHGPLYIVGYSNGGSLAVKYALSSMENSALPTVDGLVLISPAIGVARVATLAKWQDRVGRLLGLDKLAWATILPEYDPFKYNSFPVSAADQVHRLTGAIQASLRALGASGRLTGFPKVLVFQSVVDSTVSPAAVVKGLLARLPRNGNELVLFDINRLSHAERLFRKDPQLRVAALLGDRHLPFTVSIVTNKSKRSSEAVVRTKGPDSVTVTEMPLGLTWPGGIYSLSHIALPFSEKDELYGSAAPGDNSRIWLGDLTLRGERDVLLIPAGDILRLRWNPFHDHMVERLVEFILPVGS